MPRLIALICILMAWSGAALAQSPSGPAAERSAPAAGGPRATERITAELVSMSAWATPGSTLMVAVRQDIRPGWHTYWRNPGDSGGATTLDWILPAGLSAGEIIWPLPERQRLGELMNYGYSGTVHLPVPIMIPADAAPGSRLTLRTTALFLVCSAEMCVPDELELALTVPVAQGAAPDTDEAGAIRRVLETSPRPADLRAAVGRAEDGRLTLSVAGPELQGVRQAWFFPFEGGLIDHAATQPGSRGEAGLTLQLRAGRGLGTGVRPLAGVLATDRGAYEITAQPGPPVAGTTGEGSLTDPERSATGGMVGLFRALGLALIGGLILNLMPCVFPVLAMKAAGLAAGAHDPARARRDALFFLAGVLSAFLALGGLMLALRAAGEAVGWGFQLQSPGVVVGLGLLALAVGLNLSGVYHMGAGLQSAAGGPLARIGGAAGAFLTGGLAVAVAAPCTAPFMAAALGAALVLSWPAALGVFLALGLGLALPYVLLGFSPGALRRLPRPGPWMDRLKGLLAFPMYGTALWLAWVAAAQLSTEGLALILLAGLILALALWLFGQSQRSEGRSRAIFLATCGLAAAGALGAAWTGASSVATASAAQPRTALPSQPWSAQAVADAQALGRPVLVNFTADWCVTCKLNERIALSSPRVAQALDDAGALYLVGDWTSRDAAIAAELERRGRSGVPLYLLFPAGGGEPRVLPQLLTEGTVIDALSDARPAIAPPPA